MDTRDRLQVPPMRASDADRDQVLATLSEAFQAGRLTSEELEDRTSRALTARTLNDLDGLTADLPPAAANQPAPVPVPSGPGIARLPAVGVVALVLVVAGIVFGAGSGGHDWRFAWVLVVVPLIARRIAVGRAGTGRR
jgi:Domain of unknown function (DUF1707)